MPAIMRLTFCSIVFIICGCEPRLPETSGLDRFANSFKAANQAETIHAMLDLYDLTGSGEQTLQLLKPALQNELGLPIQSISFEPLRGAPEEKICFEFGGKQYGPTLEPKLRMRVQYATEDGFSSLYTIGQGTGGRWRIVSSRPMN
ncbi:MAG: hypothetical protein ACPG3X_00640 [Opitutales bacterium]